MLLSQGRTAAGLSHYRTAVELSTEPWLMRVKLAQRLRLAGDPEGSLEELRKSLAQKPTPPALAQLSASLLEIGKYRQAKRIAEGLLASDNVSPIMVRIRDLADSAARVNAPPGSIRLGVPFD
jgi:Flp pilus assembly protein TadD